MPNSQKDLILSHLRRHGSISSWEAITHYRITRLGAVIFTLKGENFNISDEWEFKEDKHWKRYRLEEFKVEPSGQMNLL